MDTLILPIDQDTLDFPHLAKSFSDDKKRNLDDRYPLITQSASSMESRTMCNVGASPAKKQKQMGRSYAAVVRSSFKPTNPNSAVSNTVASNVSKLRSQTLEARRGAGGDASCIVAPSSTDKSFKKQRTTQNANPMEYDVHPYLRKLDQALELEVKFRGAVQPTANGGSPLDAGTITSGMRDGSAHVLRCLKVWYDLPSDVFFSAISSIDRFLAKMKAQPKHLSCIAVSSFHLACHQYRQLQQEQNCENLINIPEPSDLVSISQSRCSPSDLLRMQNILQSKLEINPAAGPESPVTTLSFLRIMYSVCRAASLRLNLDTLLPSGNDLPDNLIHQLEILACDSTTLNYRPCEVALALLATDFQCRMNKEQKHSGAIMRLVTELQKYCNIQSDVFVTCLDVVMSQLDKYNGECMVTHRQRLVWKLSNRTLRHLRPTDKLRATLPTIKETGAPIQRVRSASLCSARSEDSMSLSSEEDLTEGYHSCYSEDHAMKKESTDEVPMEVEEALIRDWESEE